MADWKAPPEHQIASSWEDLRQSFMPVNPNRYGIPDTNEYVYRGHSDSEWNLHTPWARFERENDESGFVRQLAPTLENIRGNFEKAMLRQYGQSAEQLRGNKIQTWIMGRHHGLRVPLLDWTESPYIACFFALMEVALNPSPGHKTVSIWRLLRAPGLSIPNEFEFVDPEYYAGPRALAQRAVLTLHLDDRSRAADQILTDHGHKDFIQRLDFSADVSACRALTDLHQMGIGFDTLFPDEYGAVMEAHVNWTEIRAYASLGGGPIRWLGRW